MHYTVASQTQLDNLIAFVFGTNTSNWSEIEKCHHSLIINDEIPENTDRIRECVMQSWIRCKKNGVAPNLSIQKKSLTISNVSEIRQKNDILLQVGVPLFNQYFSFAYNSEKYYVVLHDPNGVILHSSNPSLINLDFSEEKVGTTSQSLSAALDQPVCLVSPENYNQELKRATFALSIPIHDENRKVIGVLALPYYLSIGSSPDEKELIRWLFSTLFLFVRTIEETICRINYYDTKSLNCKSSDHHSFARNNNLNALYNFSDILGQSAEINQTKKMAYKISPQYGNVLLLGESGTGKELFAHSIHQEFRPQGPFIAINCASIPEGLIESELFGYEGGSFTGAKKNGNPGKLEMADGGTLFLDEIEDMPLKYQPSLLRVLDDKRIMRIGGNKYISVDFRIIAATNIDLYSLVKQHKFREDLFYRLANFEIIIPPLRDRGMDILELAQCFIEKHCLKMGRMKPVLDDDVKHKLLQFNWPGNVRQIQNAMYYALNKSENDRITIDDLPRTIVDHSAAKTLPGKPQTLSEVEKEAILEAMIYTDNHIGNAAQILDISKPTLYRRLKEYNINQENQLPNI